MSFVNGEDMLKRLPGARWFETAAFQVSVPRREAVVQADPPDGEHDQQIADAES